MEESKFLSCCTSACQQNPLFSECFILDPGGNHCCSSFFHSVLFTPLSALWKQCQRQGTSDPSGDLSLPYEE
jgi:hypothetical protein